MDLQKIGIVFGNDSIYKYTPEYYNFKDGVRTKQTRVVGPNTKTPMAAFNTGDSKVFYTFETKLEHFTPLKECFICPTVRLLAASSPIGSIFNMGDMVQCPFNITQMFKCVEIYINNCCVSHKDLWSFLPAFLVPINQEEKEIQCRPGLPFQKIVQQNNFNVLPLTNGYVNSSAYDLENEVNNIINIGSQNTFQIPLYHFSNFFWQNFALPPGVVLKIKFIASSIVVGLNYNYNTPGNSYTQLTYSSSVGFIQMDEILKINLMLNYYEMSGDFTKDFLNKWKHTPFTIRYSDLILSPFPCIRTNGITSSYQQRIEVNSSINTCLFFFISNDYLLSNVNNDGMEFVLYPNEVLAAEKYITYALPNTDLTPSALLHLYPFKINKLRVYCESANANIISIDESIQDAEFIHYYLKQKTKNYFKTSDKDLPINRSDIYGMRVAPVIIPLSHEKILSNHFAAVPKKLTYIISYDVTDLENNPIEPGYKHHFFHVQNQTIKINSDNTIEKYNSADIATSTYIEQRNE